MASRNPAQFNNDILGEIRRLLAQTDAVTIVDPFAGEGGIHKLRADNEYVTYGIELEPEWAHANELGQKYTVAGSCLDSGRWMDLTGMTGLRHFDAIVTSPCYGNRMADTYTDHTQRNTYTAALERELSEGSAAAMQWGTEYRKFHIAAWAEATEHARFWFILNIKDHIRAGVRQKVSQFHDEVLQGLGWQPVTRLRVEATGNRNAANADLRVPYESLFLYHKLTEGYQ